MNLKCLDDLRDQEQAYISCDELQENELDYIDVWIRAIKEV